MTSDQPFDPFEQELRKVLAEEAAEPAPERLLARVAAIRHEVRPGLPPVERVRARLGGGQIGADRGATLGLAVGLAAASVVLVVVGAALIGGPGPVATVGSPPPSVGTAVRLASLTRAIEALRTVIRELGIRRELGVGGLGPTGGPVPAGFEPASVTFVSADLGWVLGTATCAGSPCAAIVRTTDGGRTWASIPAPDAPITPGRSEGGSTGVSGPAGVGRLRFANALDGWAFGPALFATHDGGATWHRVMLPGAAADAEVMALETSAGLVHAAYFDGASSVVRIATSPVGGDAWTVSPTTMPVGAGPVPQAQIVLRGTAGWLVEVDRTVVGGARLVAGEWQAWQPPCVDLAGPATLAAASEWELVAACDVGLWSTPKGVHLWVSMDAGASFIEAAAQPPVFSVDGVGAPSASSTVVAGSLSGIGSALVASFDGGRTWDAVYVLEGAASVSDLGFTDLGFATAGLGVAITTSLSTSGVGDAHLIMTRDGGRTWSEVTIAAP